MSSYYLSNAEKSRHYAEYCRNDVRAASRLSRLGLDEFLGSIKVIREEHVKEEPTTKHDLAKLGVPRETIEALDYADKEHTVAKAMFAWQRREAIRGRAFGLLLYGAGKGKSVAACMAIDPRFTRNTDNHTKLCVAESTLMALEMRKDSEKELQRYRWAHTLVVDSTGQNGMYSKATAEAVIEMMRKRWADQKFTILTSRADLPKLKRVYGDNWVTIEKYCHMVEVEG